MTAITNFFKELFEYNHSTNQKLIQSFLQQPDKVSEKSIQLINHIFNAHQIWNHRIQPQSDVPSVWQIHSLGKLNDQNEINFNTSIDLLSKVDLGSTINYTNTKGLTFTNSVQDVLFHVINHSNYHRAQIASDFKQNGLPPLVSDFIVYKR